MLSQSTKLPAAMPVVLLKALLVCCAPVASCREPGQAGCSSRRLVAGPLPCHTLRKGPASAAADGNAGRCCGGQRHYRRQLSLHNTRQGSSNHVDRYCERAAYTCKRVAAHVTLHLLAALLAACCCCCFLQSPLVWLLPCMMQCASLWFLGRPAPCSCWSN
jgi:hypothetical protein